MAGVWLMAFNAGPERLIWHLHL